MVRKKFDRTVVKKCPKCEEPVPVACKHCTCGHPFASRNKQLLKEEAEEATMGLIESTSSDVTKEDESPADRLRRPRRLTREKPNYFVITELNRQVKKARQKVRSSSGIATVSEVIPKKKKRGRPRGSGSRNKSKRKALYHNQQPQQPSLNTYHHIGLQEIDLSDSKSAAGSPPNLTKNNSLMIYNTGSGSDKNIILVNTCSVNMSGIIHSNANNNNIISSTSSSTTNNNSNGTNITITTTTTTATTTAAVVTATINNIPTTTNIINNNSNIIINNSNDDSSSNNNNNTINNNNNGTCNTNSNESPTNYNGCHINNIIIAHSKDSNNSNSSVNSSSNSTIATNYGTKSFSNITETITTTSSSVNSTNTNNNSNGNNNGHNGSRDNGAEKDMYTNMSAERALQFYAILADLNRKIISQSFKPW